MYTDKLKKVFLAHVSKDSNNISLIKETLEDEFIGMIRKPNCEITTQDNVTKLFDIDEIGGDYGRNIRIMGRLKV